MTKLAAYRLIKQAARGDIFSRAFKPLAMADPRVKLVNVPKPLVKSTP